MATKKAVPELVTEPETLAGLNQALQQRGLSITIYLLGDGYAVWVFPADDPVLGVFPGEGDDLPAAIADALRAWDHAEIEEVGGEDEPTEPN